MTIRNYIVMPRAGWTSGRMRDFAAGRPLHDIVQRARVVAFADTEGDDGAARRTGRKGVARFRLPHGLDRIPRLLIEAPSGFHGAAAASQTIAADGTIEVTLRGIVMDSRRPCKHETPPPSCLPASL